MGTQLPHPKWAQPTPNFRPMSIVAKRSLILATAERLSRYSELFVESDEFFLSNLYLLSPLGIS